MIYQLVFDNELLASAFILNRRYVDRLKITRGSTEEEQEIILQAVKTVRSLPFIEYTYMGLGAFYTNIILDSLTSSEFIRHLNLAGNHIGDEGALHIANFIRESNSIKYIDLSDNDIEDHTAITEIANSMVNSRTISCIDLSSNFLSVESTLVLVQSMLNSNYLISINLSWNRFINYKQDLVTIQDFAANRANGVINLFYKNTDFAASEIVEFFKGSIVDYNSLFIDRVNEESVASSFQGSHYLNSLSLIFKIRSILGISNQEANFLTDCLICIRPQYQAPGNILNLPYEIIEKIGLFLGFEEISNIAIRGIKQLQFKDTKTENFISVLNNKYLEPYIRKVFLQSKEEQIQKLAKKFDIPINVKEKGIEYSYKKIALIIHPDKAKDDGKNMQMLNEIRYSSENKLLDKFYSDVLNKLNNANIAIKSTDLLIDSYVIYNELTWHNVFNIVPGITQLIMMYLGKTNIMLYTSASAVLFYLYEGDYNTAISLSSVTLGYSFASTLLMKQFPALSVTSSLIFTTLAAFNTIKNGYYIYNQYQKKELVLENQDIIEEQYKIIMPEFTDVLHEEL